MKLAYPGSFFIEDIEIGERLRSLDEAYVALLAETIKEGGLQHPIRIARLGNSHRLVAGAHRLAAYKLLGRTEIPAHVVEPETDDPETEIRFDEVIENTARRELSALDRASHFAELRRLWGKLHPELKRGGDRKSKGQHDPLIADEGLEVFSLDNTIRDRTGFSTETFNKLSQIWRALEPASRQRIRGTWLEDNRAQLYWLVKYQKDKQLIGEGNTPPSQAAVLDLLLSDPPRVTKVQDAVHLLLGGAIPKKDTRDWFFVKLKKAWLSAPRDAQVHFALYLQDVAQVVIPPAGEGKPKIPKGTKIPGASA